MKQLLLPVLFCAAAGLGQAQITVSSVTTSSLTNYLQGYGLTISNMQITGNINQIGFFSGVSNMAFGSGVVMSTGVVYAIPGPAYNFASVDLAGAGDPDLDLACGMPTYDASVIEFDCVPTNDTILFDFAFGSEEYPEYINSGYNDVFTIYISGPDPSGGNYVNNNLALVPGTTLPVSVNSINSFVNAGYYIDNTNDTVVALDGYTTGLQGLVGVTPGSSYHFKIAIADAGDHIYDSGVMFLTNSFRCNLTLPAASIATANDFSVFPVPASNELKIISRQGPVNGITISDAKGCILFSKKQDGAGTTEETLDISQLSPGLYYITLTGIKGTCTKKLVKE